MFLYIVSQPSILLVITLGVVCSQVLGLATYQAELSLDMCGGYLERIFGVYIGGHLDEHILMVD